MLLTDIFPDRGSTPGRSGCTTLAAQINQAIGLAIGGAVVGLIGDTRTLLLDLLTFVVGAPILTIVRPPKSARETRGGRSSPSLLGRPGPGLAADPLQPGPDLHAAALAGQRPGDRRAGGCRPALRRAAQHLPELGWHPDGGADPRGRRRVCCSSAGCPAERQSSLVIRLALLTPLPLLLTIFEPPLPVVWAAWFLCGALQSYMLPLQAAFTLLVPTAMRGRVFGLAGALSVGVTGACFLVAGWISEHTTPAASVGICAVVTLGIVVLLAARWPKEEVAGSVEATFTGHEFVREAGAQPGSESGTKSVAPAGAEEQPPLGEQLPLDGPAPDGRPGASGVGRGGRRRPGCRQGPRRRAWIRRLRPRRGANRPCS